MPPSEMVQAEPLIPGAYERNTLTHRQIGSMGGPPFGATDVPTGSSSLSAATIADREREGGGGPSQRRPRIAAQSGAGGASDTEHNESRSTGVHVWLQLWWRLARR